MRHVQAEIARMLAAGDERVIVMAVPNHRLSRALMHRAREKGISVEVWRGFQRRDFDDEPMCKNLEVMKKSKEILAHEPCSDCPLQKDCRYIGQREKTADLWIVAHATLFQTAPKPIGKKGVAFLIVDETAWPSATKCYELPLDQLDPGFMAVGKGLNGQRLEDIRGRLKSAAGGLDDDQRIARAHLLAVGFDDGTSRLGVSEEWNRHVPGKVEDERLEPNRSILAMMQAWKAVGALFKAPDGERALGWLKVTRQQEDGVRVLSVSGRRRVHNDFTVPTLLIDADLDPTLNRLVWPDLKVVADLKVNARHQTVLQAADRVWNNTGRSGSRHGAEW